MNIEEAREILAKFSTEPVKSGLDIVQLNRAVNFIEGWDSRETEVEELKKEIERLKNPREGMDVSEFYPEETK